MRISRRDVVVLLTMSLSVCLFSNYVFADGLTVTVVNGKNEGVYSKIFAKTQTGELIVGVTGRDGKMADMNYHCTSDRNLVARPIDETYFDSNLEPCESPQSFLVASRITSAGYIAFNSFNNELSLDGYRYLIN
jgi:hypothetical protein